MNERVELRKLIKILLKNLRKAQDAEFLRSLDAFMLAVLRLVLSYFGLGISSRGNKDRAANAWEPFESRDVFRGFSASPVRAGFRREKERLSLLCA